MKRKSLFLILSLLLAHPVLAVPGTSEGTFSIDKDGWVKASAGYDFSFLGDVVNGIKAWKPFAESQGYSDLVSTDQSGIRVAVEAGLRLDSNNAFSLSVENIWTQTEIESLRTSSGSATRSLMPDLLGTSLNYYRYISQGEKSRTFLMAGVGFYHAMVEELFVSTASFSGVYTGDTLGGTIGIGQEWAVRDSISVEIGAKGRIATFNKVIATSGSIVSSSEPNAMIIYPYQGNDIIEGKPLSSVGVGGIRYAVIDYSGFCGDISLKFHF